VLPLWLPVPARSSATKRDAADHTRAQQRGGWSGAPAQLASLGAYSVPPCPRAVTSCSLTPALSTSLRAQAFYCPVCHVYDTPSLPCSAVALGSSRAGSLLRHYHHTRADRALDLVTPSARAFPPRSVRLARLRAPPRSVISRHLSLAGASDRAAVYDSRRYDRCEVIGRCAVHGRSAAVSAAHGNTATMGLATALALENYTRVMLGRPRPATATGVAVELGLVREHDRSPAHERTAGINPIAARKYDTLTPGGTTMDLRR
jgi:hypothetical protein